ncbi:bifunctional 4-hydroxy-2-oxoglutarate aldolase/2-dehydro-3-deoxy-phosphogluconate aldolase [Alicyclobacillus fastidiosus]|uniref:Bifunctional 4-hydroxy-2-oxoglutarate aldolase/2-dehydro-3-deoxy-phosphogluconate aldolase n=1 Tax=Alicyclobacillus fastidiosus TaxID=392011 RepID=A0ABY6ZEE6_9BACL|nr:bifunctional 4-hydroxy-2-oxoglutarate aldolase/2-dehydro-3-deoxy-phosphogluconate aldolase [Alicyclobacillus fastidiosus]WAH41269.1 bifunctional 4-hydroxy-2-oxoglutarate aldolase/2-dehydro-3-deoxy-phosphogluconate aldolase [Alicyclobacillus fastidiosus]
MNLENAVERVKSAGVVAIFRKLSPKVVLPLCQAVIAGGAKAVEVTVESEGAFESIRAIRQEYGSQLLIGAGTLMTREEVQQAVEAGADFLLSPHVDAELIETARDLGRPFVPGVATPTEVVQALRLGAEVLKLFPASSLGSAYLRDLLGPFKGTSFIPTGGITVDNAAEFIRAGAVGVGMGSSLASKGEIAHSDWDSIENRVRMAVDRIDAAKNGQV